jgi:hypothetical protein
VCSSDLGPWGRYTGWGRIEREFQFERSGPTKGRAPQTHHGIELRWVRPVGQGFQGRNAGEIGGVPALGQLGQLLGMLRGTQALAGLDHPRQQVGRAIHSCDELGESGETFDTGDIVDGSGGRRDHRRMVVGEEWAEVF